ncbi:hypothetical protein NPIL_12011 [Nephila pilipes]|uniref:Uncharacterized protein n=1 Tax=Nephila pilipes TaxID=299642 RepID=A0A8X6QU60_NEPPI|nr:hypothetical protein NPIL_12011 [Nephila pilipes]
MRTPQVKTSSLLEPKIWNGPTVLVAFYIAPPLSEFTISKETGCFVSYDFRYLRKVCILIRMTKLSCSR